MQCTSNTAQIDAVTSFKLKDRPTLMYRLLCGWDLSNKKQPLYVFISIEDLFPLYFQKYYKQHRGKNYW